VLVADSYHGARVPCARYLHRFGFQVEEAADGEQALALVNSAPPHVILAEDTLPQVSADRLTRWLAHNWRTRHIPIIVLTGDQPPDPRAAPAPAAAILVKPFPLPLMLETIRRVLRVRGTDTTGRSRQE
jgi:DNA-binding response OmpR family regulator